MHRNRGDATKRFASSAVIALPMTVALLFLMTLLILPSDRDPIVTRMIQNIEFKRSAPPPELTGIQVFDLPPPIKRESLPIKPTLTVDGFSRPQDKEIAPNEALTEEAPAHVIDWWAEARKITQEADDEAFKRWLLEQGYDRYVSIMQGPLPITNSVRGTLSPTQGDNTGYRNTYGDLELKISKNCVIQSLISTRFDMSDFAKNLPMRVVCKSDSIEKYDFERD